MQLNESISAASVVWKTEGTTDLLALLSLHAPPDHAAICNPFGAGENPFSDGGSAVWMLKRLAGKTVYVIHDCDNPGQTGALLDTGSGATRRLGWAPAIALFAKEVRNIVLPYPIEEKHGKDLRDWINEKLSVHSAAGLDDKAARKATYADLLELAAESAIIPSPDPGHLLTLTVETDSAPPAEVAEGIQRKIMAGYEAPRAHGDLSAANGTGGGLMASKEEPSPADEVEFLLEAIDDPHRLAKINLDTYRTAHGREVKYWSETWYLWKSGRYVEITRDHFESRLNLAIKREFNRVWSEDVAEYEDWKKSDDYEPSQDKGMPRVRKVTRSLVQNVLDATKSLCFVSSNLDLHSWLDGRGKGETYLSAANGMVNLTRLIAKEKDDSKIIGPHSPLWFSTLRLPYQFTPDATCDRWQKFLTDVFNGDIESIEVLQKWFGYLLTPDMSLNKALFVIGPTRSGKGTIAAVLREMIGHEAVGTPTLSSLGQQFGLASLVGKTVAIISDARMPNKADESIITERLLNITGGDPVTISRKHKTDLSDFKLKCRFTLFSNLLPKLKDASAAFVSRCIFLSMPNSYLGQEDLGLQGKLLDELPGILNWAIRGREKLDEAKGKIQQPVAGLSLFTELQSMLNPVSLFLQDSCEVGDGYSVATKELFAAWANWCEENDAPYTGNIQSFARRLRAAMPKIDTTQKTISPTGGRERFFIGIRPRVEDIPE